MQDKRDDYEPIIATRRSREPLREEGQPLWKMVLTIVGTLIVLGIFAWWWMSRSSGGATTDEQAQTQTPTNDLGPAIQVEQPIAPPARDSQPENATAPTPTPTPTPTPSSTPTPSVPQPAPVSAPENAETAPTSESVPSEVAEDDVEALADDTQTPAPPALVSVKLMSPDDEVRFELRSVSDASLSLTSNAGDEVNLQPGRYRVKASGPQLQTFEQELLVDGDRPMEYTVELCAQRAREREELVGKVVEERQCNSTAECQTMFNVLSEYADELVRDRGFRTQQCAKWREKSVPDGSWTLNINCGGATLATTCRIEIAEGACSFAEPPSSARGTACPRVELH